MTSAEIRAVVFDLDGVYFESGTEKFIKALQDKYLLSEEVIKEVYFRSPQMQEYKKGNMSDQDFWKYASRTWNISASQEEIIEMLIKNYQENPEMQGILEALRNRNVKTAICTNNFPARLEGLKKHFRLEEKFDVIVASYEEGTLKPDERMFLRLAEKLNLSPQDIAISDDQQKNIDQLQKMGFQAFLYTGVPDFKARIVS